MPKHRDEQLVCVYEEVRKLQDKLEIIKATL